MIEYLEQLWRQTADIWQKGDWAMYVLAAVAIVMFGTGMHVFLRLWQKRFRSVHEKVWRRWVDLSSEREGPIGRLIEFGTDGDSLENTRKAFMQLQETEVAPFERDLKVMKVCVGAAPLVGLLGTVTGMLATFNALSTGSGGDQTMAMIAAGISQALITTETGLVIALPGLFFQYHLTRQVQKYRAFLAHLETVCTQVIYKKTRQAADAAMGERVREAARARVVRQLQAAVRSA